MAKTPKKTAEPESKTSRARTMPLTVSRPELLTRGRDAEFRRLVHGLLGFLARHQAIRDGLGARIGLAGIEYTTLISIAHLGVDGDVNVKTVADHLHVSGAFVTTVTRKLQSQGLVSKTPGDVDRRRVLLTVTDDGYKLLAELAPFQRAVNDTEFAGLSREKFLLLLDIVENLMANSEQAMALQSYLSPGGTDKPLAGVR
jgi:MarR family transcriptional regulator, organic hydroperoxide resistance regulator